MIVPYTLVFCGTRIFGTADQVCVGKLETLILPLRNLSVYEIKIHVVLAPVGTVEGS